MHSHSHVTQMSCITVSAIGRLPEVQLSISKGCHIMDVHATLLVGSSWCKVEVSCHLVHCDVSPHLAALPCLCLDALHVGIMLTLLNAVNIAQSPSSPAIRSTHLRKPADTRTHVLYDSFYTCDQQLELLRSLVMSRYQYSTQACKCTCCSNEMRKVASIKSMPTDNALKQ